MPSLVDLHSHSSVSDGSERPETVVRKAAANGVRFLALTDHDGTGGLDEAIATAAELDGMRIIPGIELSAEEGVHMLGYFIGYDDPELQSTLRRLQEGREGRAHEMLDKLAALGMPLEFERVKRIADGAIGRPHVARAMVERGYVGSVPEAFDKWLAIGKQAYIPSEKLTAAEAIEMIRRAGGVPSWAHPEWPDGPQRYRPTEETLRQLVDAGLQGIEVYYSDHLPEMRARFLDLARKYNLVPTGGSDYHGPEVRDIELGAVEVPEETVARLRERARKS
ncbi:MAG TPA: PHP domain-containing protein [Chloroflexota bacterium]|nr:PHP domain-containing protein [Chloroflexota bacterium]